MNGWPPLVDDDRIFCPIKNQYPLEIDAMTVPEFLHGIWTVPPGALPTQPAGLGFKQDFPVLERSVKDDP
ncbi:MAG: hypothetical protein ACFCVA_17610 [Gammaproteobacteria bacterium]